MQRGHDCLTCILDDLQGALGLLEIDEPTRGRVVSRALRYLAEEFQRPLVPSTFITAVHRILKEETGLRVPFQALREACNRVGRTLAGRVREETAGLPERERFRARVEWAIAANHLDFRTVGAGYGFREDEIYGMLREKLALGLHVDEVERIYALAQAAASVVYVPDNVGELAFDLLVIECLRTGGRRVTLPLRGGPITSDATLEDGAWMEVERHVDRVIRAGPDTLGISWDEASPELREALAEADLVLTKGQANYYVLSEYADRLPGAVACLLTTKCRLVSSRFGWTERINVACVLQDGRSHEPKG